MIALNSKQLVDIIVVEAGRAFSVQAAQQLLQMGRKGFTQGIKGVFGNLGQLHKFSVAWVLPQFEIRPDRRAISVSIV